MQQRETKSAPGRPKSRKHTMHDIEEWVLQDCMLAQEKTRHSGHPPENITEERLLKTKLMELGKDRFKVLARLNAEKQTFIDKQRRKPFMMKRSRSEGKLKRTKLTREASFEKGDTSSVNDVPELGQRKNFNKGNRPKTVHFDTSAKKSEYNAVSTKIRPHTVAVNPTDIETTLITTDASQFMLDMNAHISDSSSEIFAIDISESALSSTSFSRSVSLLSDSDISFKVPQKSRRNALRPVSITEEPRYFYLEKALSKPYAGHCKLDVKTIIERTESLQRTSQRSGKEARRALQDKIKQFMIDRDISFRHLVV